MHSPFDIMADTYDADFTHTAIGKLQRKQVWEFIRPLLHPDMGILKILEILFMNGILDRIQWVF